MAKLACLAAICVFHIVLNSSSLVLSSCLCQSCCDDDDVWYPPPFSTSAIAQRLKKAQHV